MAFMTWRRSRGCRIVSSGKQKAASFLRYLWAEAQSAESFLRSATWLLLTTLSGPACKQAST